MNARKMILLALVVFAMCLSPAMGSVILGQWLVDQDNYNDNIGGQTTWNHGASGAGRAAKVQQETTWYGDWSDNDLEGLGSQIAALAAGGATYGNSGPNQYWVEFRTATADWGIHGGVNFVPEVAAFFSKVDWVELQATHIEAFTGQPWVRHTDSAPVTFWSLVEVMNTAPVVGNWATSSTPANVQWNNALLDPNLVIALINDPNCRGLRMEDIIAGGWFNDRNLAREQWGGVGAPRLVLFFEPPPPPPVSAVPEPAGMGLLGLGLVGFALRRRRTE